MLAELAAELDAAPLDLDALAELDPAPWWWSPSSPQWRCWWSPDLDALAELVAIALVAAVVSGTWWSPS